MSSSILSSIAMTNLPLVLLFCLMFISQVQGSVFDKEASLPRLTCPADSVTYFSYCYTLSIKPTSWMDASISCQKYSSGHLASVTSGSEAFFLSALIKNSLSSFYDVWIGLHDPSEGVRSYGSGWEWSNTDMMSYNAWETNPPIPNAGYCGTVTKNSDFLKWKDNNCDTKLPYICKFKY